VEHVIALLDLLDDDVVKLPRSNKLRRDSAGAAAATENMKGSITNMMIMGRKRCKKG
jgi:hypothetical protein